jgi:molybdate/tungstate transport system substrate-binding protein
LLLSGCASSPKGKPKEIIVFHAGSLSVPLNLMREEYEKLHPDIRILLEPAGSLVCARKITELRKPCDIIASADYFVINELLIPEYTKWSVRFATNEIVIAYSDRSRYASEINRDNWTDILLRDDVIFSRSDPDADPCGYRAVFTIMLMEKLHGKQGLAEKMLSKNRDFIRPKEVDLVALIEANAADYMFQYKSVAIQHGLRYLELPEDVNLSVPEKSSTYQSVSFNVAGKKPGTKIKVTGDYITYSLSVLDSAPERIEAVDFACFILSERGIEIFRSNGQSPIKPFSAEQPDKLPEKIREYLTGKISN